MKVSLAKLNTRVNPKQAIKEIMWLIFISIWPRR